MFANPRVRAVVGAGTALAVVAGIGIGLATSSSAASNRFVTASASTGDVTQTYSATGTVARKNTSEVSFAVDGTVKKVYVAVGDSVDAGDTLAVLNKGELQLAVLNATTTVAQAEASLYSAQHPASASSSSKASSAKAAKGATAASVVIDPAVLNEAVSRINLAIQVEAGKCDAIFSSILPSPSPTATPSSADPSATPTATDHASAESPASATPTATPTPTASSDASAKADQSPVATASASQLAKTLDEGDFTDAQLQDCADARAEVILANANLQQVVGQLTGQHGGTGTGGKKSGSSSSSSSTKVSKSAVARAKATLLQAQQELASAQEDLSKATLVAPISGTVGLVGLSTGDSASAGSITIVGSGSAVVTFELPLTTRELVKVGQSVTVTPAGSTKALTGKITAIASLQTSGTSGDTSTYTTTVAVSDAAGLLATGAKASVTIPVKSVTGVVRVPASAVTPTGAGTATVQVVDSANATSASSVTVQTGAVGGGWVQITSGLDAGTLVVLADTTAEIPSNTTNNRRTTSSGTSSTRATSTRASTGATTAPTTGGQAGTASTQPTSSASR